MIRQAITADPVLRRLLAGHPEVSEVLEGPDLGVRFQHGGRWREVLVGRSDAEIYGLLELIDNNPIVCADAVSVPSPGVTLASVAVGPLASAGIIYEAPTMLSTIEVDEAEAEEALARLGWSGGLTLHSEPADLGGVVAATVICAIASPDDPMEIDALYEERYGGSFFVRRDEDSQWHTNLVVGRPESRYRLRIALDQPVSLLTVQLLANRHGKCGAAQVLHAMNVMCGFADSAGIA